MNTYDITGSGRRVGAIGIFYKFKLILHANNLEEANEKLYEKYEHISGLNITEYPQEIFQESNSK